MRIVTLVLSNVEERQAGWEKVLRRIRAREMSPIGAVVEEIIERLTIVHPAGA
jgi:hypothetical protein